MTTPRKQLNNLRRLIKLAEEFRDSKTKLNMDSYASCDSPSERAPTRKQALSGACGTTFCLVGRAGMEPHFRRQGLKTDFRCDADGFTYEVFSTPGCEAEFELFGIRDDQQHKTFYHDNILTPTGSISKKRTLNAIIKNLKEIALENFGVQL